MRRRTQLLAICFTALLLPSPPTHGEEPAPSIAQEVERGHIPEWLAPRAIPEVTPEMARRSRNGISYLITDWQVRGSEAGTDSYYRVAQKVMDRSGLEGAGKIEAEFDPRYEHVTLNYVHVIRDGHTIDRTAEAELKIVQREASLDEGLIYGKFTAIANLKDIRVGDIVDYATTYHSQDKLWPGHFFGSFAARLSDPVGLRAVRIAWPVGYPLTYKTVNSDISFQKKREGNSQILEWVGKDVPEAAEEEKDVPDWFPQYGRVNISTMTTWGEVARWASRFYEGDDTLTPDFEKRLDDIAQRWPDPADRLTEVTRYVQDNIRYVGEEMGEGSYVPRRPKTVLQRGYGDCKDKSLLLAVALRKLGITATPALASTEIGLGLPDRLPSPIAFNHVVVRATLNGAFKWIDATATHQGGRGNSIVSVDYGYGLPIKPDQQDLEKMSGPDKRSGGMSVIEKYAVDEHGNPALSLLVETVYTDADADWMRQRVAVKPVKDLSEDNLDFYRQRFADITESIPLKIEDERDANRITMIENYSLSGQAFKKEELLKKFITRAYALTNMLPSRQTTPRRNPLFVTSYLNREHVIELSAKGRTLWRPENIEEKYGNIAFKRNTAVNGDIERISYSLKTADETHISPDQAAGVYKVSDKISDETGLEFYLEKSGKQPAASTNPLTALIAPYSSEMKEIGELMAQANEASFIKALSKLNDLSARIERPSEAAGLIDGLKGLILAGLNRIQPARTSLESSIGQYHGNKDMMLVLVAIQTQENDPLAAIETLKVAAKYQPTIVSELKTEIVYGLYQQLRKLENEKRRSGTDDLNILLGESGWKQTPMTSEGDGALSAAVQALLRRNDPDNARKLLAKGLSTSSLVSLAVDNRFRSVWPDIDADVRNRFHTTLVADVKRAAEVVANNPDEFKTMTVYLRALRHAGQAEKAVETGKRLAVQKDRIEATGNDAFWFINEYAGALHDAGRPADAIRAFDSLLAFGLDNYPMLVSQAINRTEALISDDRPAEALTALNELDEKYMKYASSYGKMWVWAGKVCALNALGRSAEAIPYMTKLDAQLKDNMSAVMKAGACVGDIDKVEQIMLSRLDSADDRTGALLSFVQFTGAEAQSRFDAKVRDVITKARNRPAVQAKFRSYGRAIELTGSNKNWEFF
jgi:transglutaminase-like putative cysteine protease/tetratricopeptide (TPR) repeat protein